MLTRILNKYNYFTKILYKSNFSINNIEIKYWNDTLHIHIYSIQFRKITLFSESKTL